MSDARTEREVGRYDRTTGRLSVGDQARVYEVVRALWAYLNGGIAEAGGGDEVEVQGEGEGGGEAGVEGAGEVGGGGEVGGEGEDGVGVRVGVGLEGGGVWEGYGRVGAVGDGRAGVAGGVGRVAVVAVAEEAAAPQPQPQPRVREPHGGAARVVELRVVPAGPETGVAERPGVAAGVGDAGTAQTGVRAGSGSGRGGGGRAGRVVDRRLGSLRRDGWAVLSSVGRLAGNEIDRLVVGPPGVFAITVRRGDEVAHFLRSGLNDSRYDAESAGRVLSDASGLTVKVRAILAFVGPGGDELAGGIPGARRTTGVIGAAGGGGGGGAGDSTGPDGVIVAPAEEIVEVLRDLSSVYSLDERYRIVDAARAVARGTAGFPAQGTASGTVQGAAFGTAHGTPYGTVHGGTASWGPIAA